MELSSFLENIKQEGIVAGFVPRIASVAGSLDKDAALDALRDEHESALNEAGFSWDQLYRAEQVHGNQLAIVPDGGAARLLPEVDGLLTAEPNVVLGIYVADCGLIWLVDSKTGALGLLHSGKKGTEGNILGEAVKKMERAFGTCPADLVGVLGPCIRPPHYEMDFAAAIRKQAREAGIGSFEDCGLCTGSDLETYYSYRMEKGKTGRMLGFIGRKTSP
ncbi:MAG: polyphenol oxidase family protein [Verrucomicrobiota bacterium JB023]|nr:polyphenol oxidase family protein [Verrucomicrobiota bacterium JB023]